MGKVLQLFPEFEEDLQSNLSETERNLCEIVVGDANRVLLGFPEGLFQTIVTSPPIGAYATTESRDKLAPRWTSMRTSQISSCSLEKHGAPLRLTERSG
jgi:tRNA G10  N-methylase Trm11